MQNAVFTFWNVLTDSQLCFIFQIAPCYFMENKVHFVPLIYPHKVLYKPLLSL